MMDRCTTTSGLVMILLLKHSHYKLTKDPGIRKLKEKSSWV